jgi:nicotinate-nucleotide adenylyltransferase
VRLGLFGGSFDPVHTGHVEPVREALAALELDRIVCLPTADPPHKPRGCVAPAHARLIMAELAWLDDERVVVSDFELTPGRSSYTIDSIEHFAAHGDPPGGARGGPLGDPHGGPADVVLLLGEDSLLALPDWRRWREIVERVEIGVLSRPGFEADGHLEGLLDQLPEPLRSARRDGRLHLVANRPVDVSSTRLRRILAERLDPPPGWLPDLVLKYLRKYPNLYA